MLESVDFTSSWCVFLGVYFSMVEGQDTSCHLGGSSCWVMCDHSETSLSTQMLQHLTEPVLLSTRYFHEDFLQFSRQPNLSSNIAIDINISLW